MRTLQFKIEYKVYIHKYRSRKFDQTFEICRWPIFREDGLNLKKILRSLFPWTAVKEAKELFLRDSIFLMSFFSNSMVSKICYASVISEVLRLSGATSGKVKNYLRLTLYSWECKSKAMAVKLSSCLKLFERHFCAP